MLQVGSPLRRSGRFAPLTAALLAWSAPTSVPGDQAHADPIRFDRYYIEEKTSKDCASECELVFTQAITKTIITQVSCRIITREGNAAPGAGELSLLRMRAQANSLVLHTSYLEPTLTGTFNGRRYYSLNDPSLIPLPASYGPVITAATIGAESMQMSCAVAGTADQVK